jgi:AcrR family transcriptional regulator
VSSDGEPRRRADVRRNEKALLDAAAAAFVDSGVDAPVRDIAARAGVGVGTVYRHFPSRADLVVAVYRHQVEACAEAGPEYLRTERTPYAALLRWVEDFVGFLATKHGLAGALSQTQGFAALHTYFLDRLVPVCADLLAAARASGEIARPDVEPLEFMRAIGNLCIGATDDQRYDARKMVEVLAAGLTVRREPPAGT